ncbi:Gfo/Idh/MocA family protein [Saccharicrinis sp. FJH2]|uniref:Gfo/Idh/MocA family protein n=1 Tax=Saccharicrinis sp. FJH65 TaxID=3344659 RepID=UPI0035F3575B
MSNNRTLKEIKWGIIGVGDVCEVKSAPAMNLVEHSTIVAVMRRNKVKAEDYARRHKVPFYTNDVDELLNHPEVNAVYIAAPPGSHADLAVKVAGAGLPCYVEKPMARNFEECRTMIEAFETVELPLWVAYYRRTLPNFVKIKELVETGHIGDIRSVTIEMFKALDNNLIANSEVNWRVDPKIAGGGYFHDLASHQLDFLDFLFGPVKTANGYSSNQAGVYPADDIVTASFAFENGIIGNGIWCFNAAKNAEKEVTTIVGSKGKITYQSFGSSDLKIDIDSGPTQTLKFEYPKHIQQYLIQTVVDELRGVGTCPSTAESAARTNKVMDWILE